MKIQTCSETRNYGKIFGIALLIATIFFLPYILMDHGLFIYYGDFNVQQIPFYKLAHEAVRSGNLGWSWTTDLGANFIGSYSFYLLGNPFFWLTIPFPTEFVPYLDGAAYDSQTCLFGGYRVCIYQTLYKNSAVCNDRWFALCVFGL